MVGIQSNPKLFTFYQYDLTSVLSFNTTPRPKCIQIQEADISIRNHSLFEMPFLYITLENRIAFPQTVSSDSQLMDYLTACSLALQPQHLPTTIPESQKTIHQYNVEDSFSILMRLANENYPPALHYIGVCMLLGKYLKQNIECALQHLHLAAEQNFSLSQVYLGYLYEYGTAVSINLEKAIDYYKAAKEAGNRVAYYLLGTCYEDGKGVPLNHYEALRLYKSAQELHLEAATFAIEQLETKMNKLLIAPGTKSTPVKRCTRQQTKNAIIPDPIFEATYTSSKRASSTPDSTAKRVRVGSDADKV